MPKFPRRNAVLCLFLGLGCLASPFRAHAATITACVANMNGTVRFVASPANCIPGLESSVQFGTSGAPGATGPTGPAGAIGPTGATGTNGLHGATGPTGAVGPTGAAGKDGSTGATGATGAPGSGSQVWSAGTTVPASYTPQNSLLGFAAVGQTTVYKDFPSVALTLPADCVASNFHASLIGASTGAVVNVNLAQAPGNQITYEATDALGCTITATTGSVASCTSSATKALSGGNYILMVLDGGNSPAATLVGAKVFTNFTCAAP